MSFADVEDRAAASAIARMTNATACFAGEAAFSVIFDNGTVAVMNGLADSAQPSIMALAGDFGEHGMGDEVTITSRECETLYLLRNPQPDGSGLVHCTLELVTP